MFESGRVSKELIAGRDVNGVVIERNTTQAAIGAATVPVNVRGIPVNNLSDATLLEVEQVDATVAVALLGTANDRGCEKLCVYQPPPKPFLTVSQIVRGRSSARIFR